MSSTAQNKTLSVENMPYGNMDKEDSIISIKKHIYDNKDDSSKFEAKIAVKSWRKRGKWNYSYQVKPHLQSKWHITFKKPKENKQNIDRIKENNNSQCIIPFHWGRQCYDKTVTMVQTCTVDNLLFILNCALEKNSNLKQIFLKMEGISDVVDYLISDN